MYKKESEYSVKTKLRELLLPAYLAGKISRESIIARLNISSRQFRRIESKYIKFQSVSHGLCDKPSNHSICPNTKSTVIELCKGVYRGFNYEHASDYILKHHNIDVSPCTIRKWQLDAKISLPKQRKSKKYMRRIPKATFGEMLQLDGTFADLLGNGNMQCLMHLVDDATWTSMAMLFEAECTDSALQILYQWCLKYGIPQSIYSDRHSTYKVNDRQRLTIEEELEGRSTRLTEFGTVCNRLGIKQIFALSPQAKGRVERKHNLYKDRLIKELRVLGINTMSLINEYINKDDGFSDNINNKFTRDPREARTASVLPTPAVLAEQFTIHNTRTVRNDYTLQLNNQVYQLSKNSMVNPRAKVIIKKYLDGQTAIFAGNHKLQYQKIENYTKPIIEPKSPYVQNQPIKTYTPSKTHPYKSNYKNEKKYKNASSVKQLEWVGAFCS